MKKNFLLALAFITFLCLAAFTTKKTVPPPPVKTIIIDPGHGGSDQGAAGLISTEARICLDISLKLGALIEKELPGIKVLYTRTTDIIPGNGANVKEGLKHRADFANQSSADLFISIHCNSAGRKPGGWHEKRVVGYDERVSYVGKGSKKRRVVSKVPIFEDVYVTNAASGTETYIWTAKENAHKEQMVSIGEFDKHDEEGIEIPENDPMINALKLIYTKKYFVNSWRLADLVQNEFQKSGRINRGVKQRNDKGIWVLHATGMPSILVETGFISNKEEEEYLVSESGQSEICQNIVAALKAYINKTPETQGTVMQSK
jgi:N-acetylmuramoyl-L-alanine amidase